MDPQLAALLAKRRSGGSSAAGGGGRGGALICAESGCLGFVLDMEATQFGMCKCGRKKADHYFGTASPAPAPAPEPEPKPTSYAAAGGGDDELPSGWEAVSDADGNTYYFNTVSGTTSWDWPTEAADADSSAGPNAATDPAAWTEQRTEAGDVYYYNEQTGETSWEQPVGFGSEGSGVGDTRERAPSLGIRSAMMNNSLFAKQRDEQADEEEHFDGSSA